MVHFSVTASAPRYFLPSSMHAACTTDSFFRHSILVPTALFFAAASTTLRRLSFLRWLSLLLLVGAARTVFLACSAGCRATSHDQSRSGNEACNTKSRKEFFKLLLFHITPPLLPLILLACFYQKNNLYLFSPANPPVCGRILCKTFATHISGIIS